MRRAVRQLLFFHLIFPPQRNDYTAYWARPSYTPSYCMVCMVSFIVSPPDYCSTSPLISAVLHPSSSLSSVWDDCANIFVRKHLEILYNLGNSHQCQLLSNINIKGVIVCRGRLQYLACYCPSFGCNNALCLLRIIVFGTTKSKLLHYEQFTVILDKVCGQMNQGAFQKCHRVESSLCSLDYSMFHGTASMCWQQS